MQPYFLPYIGYWQLIAAADRLIVLDDAAFIRRGWVHRNRILVNGAVHRFTVPLRQASQNRRINELELADAAGWANRLRATLRQNYARARFHEETLALLEPLLASARGRLLTFLLRSIDAVLDHLEITTPRRLASEIDPEHRAHGQERILALCQHENARKYLNLPGGRELYDARRFELHGIDLQFLLPRERPYPQTGDQWWPWLSIVDLLMHLGRRGTRKELSCCEIESVEQGRIHAC